MSTTAVPVAVRRSSRRAGVAVLRTEAPLFLRETGSLVRIVAFPAVLLAGVGLVPGFRESSEDLGGQRVVDLCASIVVLLAR